MSIEYVVIIVLGLAFLIEKVGSFFLQRNAARERKELYDRIQSGTLLDYDRHKVIAQSVPARVEPEPEAKDMGGYVEPEEVDLVALQQGVDFLRGV